MTRRTLAVAALAAAFVAAGCEEGEKAVAYVGDTTISREQLDEAVEHFQEEAAREGKDFPAEGTPARAAARQRLLGLLVYRAEIGA
ncbi:MAG: hypothetical protein QOF43_1070, partial [Gaiellaceae bacterium]|nr:hypothetical protein [Gaiellaceae bacterium]